MKNILEKIKINAKKMKKKICNFFNIAYIGIKITQWGALILADLKNIRFVNEHIIYVKIPGILLTWLEIFTLFTETEFPAKSGGIIKL